MPTTFERTRIASAILTAVAMLSTPAFAADEAPDTTLSLKLPCLKTEELQYDVAGKFVGDLKVGYMSTYKDLNLGMMRKKMPRRRETNGASGYIEQPSRTNCLSQASSWQDA